jgi:hypothetical protein
VWLLSEFIGVEGWVVLLLTLRRSCGLVCRAVDILCLLRFEVVHNWGRLGEWGDCGVCD